MGQDKIIQTHYEEAIKQYRHHDDILWRLTSIIVPAAVAITIYGYKQRDFSSKPAFIASMFLVTFWWLAAERLRLLMHKSIDFAKQIENAFGAEHQFRETQSRESGLFNYLYPEKKKGLIAKAIDWFFEIIKIRRLTRVFFFAVIVFDVCLLIFFKTSR